MKKIPIIILISLITFSYGYSQAPVSQMFLSIGSTLPAAPENFKEYWNPGFNVGIGLGRILTKYFTAHVYLEYHHLSADKDAFNNSVNFVRDVEVESQKILLISVNGKIVLPNTRTIFTPYVTGGIGYHMSISDAYENFDEDFPLKDFSSSSFSLNGGLGVEIRLTPQSSAYIEGRYVKTFAGSDGMSYIPIRAGFIVDL